MKKIVIGLLLAIGTAAATLWATDTGYLIEALRVTYLRGQRSVGIYDYTVQPTRTVPKASHKPWPRHRHYNRVPLADTIVQLHKQLQSTAFVVVHQGQLLAEYYYAEGGPEQRSGLWSVSKTYTALLILKAIEDGLIDHIDDPVSKYVPEFAVQQKSPLTLRHLCSMSTGLFWAEREQSPLSLMAKINFCNNLEQFTLSELYAVGEPGQLQHYDSGGMQLLGTVLERVLAGKPIAQYLAEKFWQPIGAEHDALYILDSKRYQHEKTYGGLVATARDVSRLGQAIADSGRFQGHTILSPEQWQRLTTLPYQNRTYAFGIWTGLYQDQRFYYQSGHQGQFCISFPAHNLVITRLGHRNFRKADLEDVSAETYLFIAEALRLVEASAVLDTSR